MTDTSANADRRRYFRINDQVGLNFRVVERDPLANGPAKTRHESEQQTQLQQYNEKIMALKTRLRGREPLLCELLDVMDEKLDCVIQQLQSDVPSSQCRDYRVYDVSISACGMAVTLEAPLQANAWLELQLTLLPSDNCIRCYAEVVDSVRQDQGEGFNTRINFCDIKEEDQELLIQHIVQRQSKKLGQGRPSQAV